MKSRLATAKTILVRIVSTNRQPAFLVEASDTDMRSLAERAFYVLTLSAADHDLPASTNNTSFRRPRRW